MFDIIYINYRFSNILLQVHRKYLENACTIPRYYRKYLVNTCKILRFLDIGLNIRVVETKSASLAVDVPEDVIRVEEEILRRRKS